VSVTKNHQRKIQKYQLLDSSKSPQNVLTVNITLALMPGMWPLSWLLSIEAALRHPDQWCIAKNEGGYMQTGVAKGLKIPCLFMIAEVSIRYQKKLRRLVYAVYPHIPPQYTTDPDASQSRPHLGHLGLTRDQMANASVLWVSAMVSAWKASCKSLPNDNYILRITNDKLEISYCPLKSKTSKSWQSSILDKGLSISTGDLWLGIGLVSLWLGLGKV